MTVALGVMSVPAPVDGDSIRRYETGTLPDGGLWTALRRLSDHNHTGGVNGAPISVASIPPGSITVDKLDPAVLLPYALVDGSKPFTGQVAMNSDAIIRDHLYFGAKPAGVADATLQRTGAGALRVDASLGVGVNPEASGTSSLLRLAPWGALQGDAANAGARLASNSRTDGAASYYLTSGPASLLHLSNGSATIYTVPSGTGGAPQAVTARLTVVPTGTLILAPDAGLPALAASIPAGDMVLTNTGAAGNIKVDPVGNYFTPNRHNVINLGHSAVAWLTVYAQTGTISASSREVKEGVAPLDPARAMQAVRATEAVTFDYVAPTRGPEWYDLPDDPEQAEAVLQQRLTAAPLEAAARHQSGFVAEQADELFLVGEGQTSPGNSVGVLIAALQNIDSRLAALEGVA